MRRVLGVVFLSMGISMASTDGIVLTALTYMERSYQFGANELFKMDCSAFVQRVFEVNGIKLPRTTAQQANAGVPVSLDELKPGDLLFFSTYKPGPSHVGIYIGNGKFIHASERRGVIISRMDEPYWQKRFLFARRVKNPSEKARPIANKTPELDEIGELIFILSNR